MNSRKTLHPSWLIGVESFALVVGIASALRLDVTLWSNNYWLLLAIALTAIGFLRRGRTALAVVFCAGFICGAWRASTVMMQLQGYKQYLHQTVELRGRVAEDVSYSSNGDAQLKLVDVVVGNREMPGTVWVTLKKAINIKRSDVAVFRGRLVEGFGTMPAVLTQAKLIIAYREDYSDLGRDVRDRFADGIRRAVREPEASLASGFLVGQKTALPEKLDNELRILGLTHIVVASGYNLTILVRVSRRLFMRVSRFTSLAAGYSLVVGFMAITGASPSMSRASLVTGLSLITWFYGRTIHPFILLSLSAGITVMITPSYGWGDIGWLLSFTSFFGVIVLAPLLHSYFWGEKSPGIIRQVFVETMSAQMLTFPIIAYVFGQYSPLSLLANVLILPLIPFTMALIAAGGLTGVVMPVLATAVGLPAERILMYMTTVVDRLAVLPYAQKEISISALGLVAFYCCALLITVHLWRHSSHYFRGYNIVE